MHAPDRSSPLLLTGATGFFGRALLRHVQALGAPFPVIGLSRNPDRFIAEFPEFAECTWLRLHRGDVTIPATLATLPAFGDVIHAATDSTLGPQLGPLEVYDQIVTGTRNILDLALERGAGRVLLTSSGGVYGRLVPGEPVAEGFAGAPDPLRAANAYACGKRAAEHLCALYHARHGLQSVVARCFAFIGRDLPLDVHFAAGNFIRDALWSDTIRVQGDGRSVRSYLDQRDLARWLLCILSRGAPGQAYNVGSERAITVAELASVTATVLSPGKRVEVAGAASPASYYVPDVGRARTELGLNPSVSLETAIRDAGAAARQLRS
jgi:dTDP-glucose 4,6-dehydratase